MSLFDKLFMKPVMGILTKTGAALDMRVPNPFTLHNFSRGNVQLRRYSTYQSRPTYIRHRSRSMGGY